MTQKGVADHKPFGRHEPLHTDKKWDSQTPNYLTSTKNDPLYCFQSWCPGCHKIGLPSLQQMVTALKNNQAIKFFAIQSVFEGKNQNTFEKLKETQKQYKLEIPFGQDEGDESTQNISTVMYHYRTGGTPWFIFINQEGKVVFNDFHLNTEKAIEFLQTIK